MPLTFIITKLFHTILAALFCSLCTLEGTTSVCCESACAYLLALSAAVLVRLVIQRLHFGIVDGSNN